MRGVRAPPDAVLSSQNTIMASWSSETRIEGCSGFQINVSGARSSKTRPDCSSVHQKADVDAPNCQNHRGSLQAALLACKMFQHVAEVDQKRW